MRRIGFLSMALALVMLFTCTAFASEAPAGGEELLSALSGEYEELFTVICDEKYDQLWLDACAPLGDDMAPAAAEMLKAACTGTIYGQEAVDAYGDGSDGAYFDCYFINGVSRFVFDGSAISGLDADGNEVFSHEYAYVSEFSLGGMMNGFLYETADEDAGEFKYFLMMPDTPATTYHIEFRYGSDLEALAEYNTGAYAYWLAAGIPTDRDEKLVEDVIALFCEENLAEMGEESDAAGQADAEPTAITTAEELAAIANDLSGSYVLAADIDLSGIEWSPIGAFMSAGDSPEEQEIPDDALAFTGTFDGAGHTISNLTISAPEGFAVGLFGCIANAQVGNFTLENAAVDGMVMAGDAVGYAFNSTVHDVVLKNGKVTAHTGEMSGEGMYGGIVAAGMGGVIKNCAAQAEIILPDDTANAGIVGGGLEMTSVIGCTASGSITAGNNCYGLGSISGCGFASEEFTDCSAAGVTITCGDNCRWIGGITGYAGGYAAEEYGMPITVFTGCSVSDIGVTAGENAEGIGDIVGSGFYSEQAAESMGAPFDAATEYELVDCTVE